MQFAAWLSLGWMPLTQDEKGAGGDDDMDFDAAEECVSLSLPVFLLRRVCLLATCDLMSHSPTASG